MENQPLHFYVISDSIGETAMKFATAAVAQFPSANTVLHKKPFISNKESLDKELEEAREKNAILLITLVNPDLAKRANDFCQLHNLTLFNLIDPIAKEITRRTGLEPTQKIGAQHGLSQKYFDRVDAMEFCITYDDGKDPRGFKEADIVLLGISRTSKTPLSMYLGNLGYKVANLPLIPENTLPDVLFEIDPRKIVGLTTSDEVVNLHRENRMLEYGMPPGTKYASMDRVREELAYAQALYDRLGCFVVNTAERSIEESASIIIQALEINEIA